MRHVCIFTVTRAEEIVTKVKEDMKGKYLAPYHSHVIIYQAFFVLALFLHRV